MEYLKKKKSSKVTAILLALMMVVVFIPTFAFATNNSITVTTSISIAGEQTVVADDLEVTDLNNDNALTVDDVLIAAHTKFSPGGAGDYASSPEGWVTKFWGTEGASVGYYENDAPGYSTTDSVKDGDELYAFTYKDTTGWSDSYSFFDTKVTTVDSGDTMDLVLTSWGYDESWNPVSGPCAGASVGYYDGSEFVSLGTTDSKGKVTVKFKKVGYTVLTAVGAEGTTLVPPYCKVTVKPEPITVTTSISIAGEQIVVGDALKVADFNSDDALTVDDVLIAAHTKFSPGGAGDYASSPEGWVTKFWGTEGASVGYYENDAPGYSTTDAVKDGDELYAFTYKDTANWSDAFSFFDKKKGSSAVGKKLTLKLTSWGYDDNWNPVSGPCAGASVGYYDGSKFVSLGTTDSKGEVSVTFKKAGYTVLTAVGAEGSILVPPYSKISVAKGVQPLKVTSVNKTFKVKKLKKAKQSYKAVKYSKNQGKVTYKVTYKNKKSKKALSFKNGTVTVKKKTKKGTYKLTVKVTAKGNSNYKSGSVSKTITVKVK